jgi:pimeloyl-ACP methyl ester carboxylesterase
MTVSNADIAMPQTILTTGRSVIKVFAFCCVVLTSVGQTWADFPTPQLVRLTDGRRLEYADYGDPSGPLVLYFHGIPSSHLEIHATASEIHAAGLHIVAINRPGIGRSSFQYCRRIMDWPKDVSEFLEAIGRGNEQFGIIGVSGGAPYALACARMMPHRITRVAIVSGHTPLGIPGVVPGENDRTIKLFLRWPRLAKKAVELTRRRLQRKPDKIVKRVTKKWDPNDRRLVICDPLVRRVLVGSLRQATLCGGQGVVTDVQLLGSRWGFDIADVSGPPISIWHGQCDRIAPISMGRYFHSRLVGSTFHVDPTAGHLTMFKWHSGEIYREFCTD